MEPIKLYVITRSEEHADYVEKVFTDECKAIAYCLQFKADKNSYQRDMTTVKLIENEEQIYPIEEILIGMGFIDAGLDENKCHIFKYHDYYSHKYFSYITLTGEAECVQVFADGSGEETTETIFLSKGVYNLYGILCAMRMSGIDIKQLLKPF